MQLVYNAIQGVLTILFMVGVGYGLSKRGWFNEKDSAFLSRLVLNLSLPALMFSNFTRNFDKALLLHFGPGLVVPFTVILGSYGLAALLGILLKIPIGSRGTFRALFSFTNTIFVGIPVNVALFGEQAVPIVTLYYLVNTTLFWTLGVYYIRKDAEWLKADGSSESEGLARMEGMPQGMGKSTGRGVSRVPEVPKAIGMERRVRFFSWDTVRRIFNPVMIAFFLAIGLVFLGVKLPPFLAASFKYAADMTTPLSMLIIGITVASIGFKGIRFDRYTVAVLAGRFLVGPLIAWIVLSRIETPELMGKVFLVVASLPVMTQVAIVTKAFGADEHRASVMATLTTACSLFVIPLYMFLFGH